MVHLYVEIVCSRHGQYRLSNDIIHTNKTREASEYSASTWLIAKIQAKFTQEVHTGSNLVECQDSISLAETHEFIRTRQLQ